MKRCHSGGADRSHSGASEHVAAQHGRHSGACRPGARAIKPRRHGFGGQGRGQSSALQIADNASQEGHRQRSLSGMERLPAPRKTAASHEIGSQAILVLPWRRSVVSHHTFTETNVLQ